MKRTSTRLLALLVCLLLLLTAVPVPAFAAERVTTCGGDCPFYPTIIVPGLGQSSVIVTNDDGTPKLDKNGNKIAAFPAYLQTDKLLQHSCQNHNS